MINKYPEGKETVQLARNAFIDGFNFSSLVREHFLQLGALFDAIKKIDGNEHSSAAQLCELGRYLCDDWADAADLSRESLDGEFRAFNALFCSEEVSQ